MKKRIEWIDSLKGILIILVVFGHFLLPIYGKSILLTSIYRGIYLFHMPLFVFVSGLLAKRTIDDKGNLRVDKIINYFLIGILYGLIVYLADGSAITFEALLSFNSAPWYIVSLASWMMLVPFFSMLKPCYGMTLSIVLSAAFSCLDWQTNILSISRTIHFSPFFFAGFYLPIYSLEHLRQKRVRLATVGLGMLFLLVFMAFQGYFAPFSA